MSSSDENLRITRMTYEQIAADYAQRHQDRSVLDTAVSKFTALVKPGGWVVDVGCGPGFDTAVLATHGFRTIALDYTYAMMHTGREKYGVQANFVQADMRYLPLASLVDGLWVSASMLHLKRADVPHTLKLFYNILQDGGVLYLAVKLGEGDEWTAGPYEQGESRFFTYWQENDLDRLLQEIGFRIVDGWISESRSIWIVRLAQKTK